MACDLYACHVPAPCRELQGVDGFSDPLEPRDPKPNIAPDGSLRIGVLKRATVSAV